MEISFYHLTATPLEKALPKLMEKALATGKRVLVLGKAQEKLKLLDTVLWSYSTLTFLPHGVSGEGNENDQPLLLSSTADNQNGAGILVQVEGAKAPSLEGFSKVLDIFDGNNAEETAAARVRFSDYKKAGFTPLYRKQTEKGTWEENGIS